MSKVVVTAIKKVIVHRKDLPTSIYIPKAMKYYENLKNAERWDMFVKVIGDEETGILIILPRNIGEKVSDAEKLLKVVKEHVGLH